VNRDRSIRLASWQLVRHVDGWQLARQKKWNVEKRPGCLQQVVNFCTISNAFLLKFQALMVVIVTLFEMDEIINRMQ